jgi:hypothetical protein
METLAAVLVALIFGTITVPVAALTGNSQAYCEKVLQGHYTPGKPDVCPDGNWAHVVGIAKTKIPQPKG